MAPQPRSRPTSPGDTMPGPRPIPIRRDRAEALQRRLDAGQFRSRTRRLQVEDLLQAVHELDAAFDCLPRNQRRGIAAEIAVEAAAPPVRRSHLHPRAARAPGRGPLVRLTIFRQAHGSALLSGTVRSPVAAGAPASTLFEGPRPSVSHQDQGPIPASASVLRPGRAVPVTGRARPSVGVGVPAGGSRRGRQLRPRGQRPQTRGLRIRRGVRPRTR